MIANSLNFGVLGLLNVLVRMECFTPKLFKPKTLGLDLRTLEIFRLLSHLSYWATTGGVDFIFSDRFEFFEQHAL